MAAHRTVAHDADALRELINHECVNHEHCLGYRQASAITMF